MLVPGLDFANHDDAVRIQFCAGTRGGIAILADRPYAAGDQIYTTYGPKSNAQVCEGIAAHRRRRGADWWGIGVSEVCESRGAFVLLTRMHHA